MSDTAETAAPEAPQPASQEPSATPPETGEKVEDGKDWKTETERWRHLSRENEKQAKAYQTELTKLKQAAMSEQERAIAEARAEADKAAAVKYGGRVVDAELRGELKARRLDEKQIEAHLRYLDRTRFLTEDGEPDGKAIAEWVEGIAPPPARPGMPYGSDLGQGARGQAEPSNPNQAMNSLLRKSR